MSDIAALSRSQSVLDAMAEQIVTGGGSTDEAPANKDEPETDRLNRLACLSPIEYDRVREAEAKALGIRASTLDKQIRILHQEKTQTEGIDFDDVDPWPHPVSATDLLDDIASAVKRFIICPEETVHATALWIAMTWFMDVVQVAPLAVITAPEKRCGKSQLLFLLGRLVHRPLAASNISPAALFRAVDAWKPTLLVDEADAFMRDNEELRGLLNCGHTRDSAYIVRVVGDDHIPKRFNVWGAKALAGIGHLADTIMDRAITLELRRKLPSEEVMRLRHAEPGLFDDLVSRLARFANDNREALRCCRPDLPAALNDRAQDNWEPLLAIAEISKGRWPEFARHAALKLSGQREDSGTVGNELLADIREVFETKRVAKISTTDLISELCADDEKPWATYNRGRVISPRQVAKKLKDYGIASKNIRISYEVVKGFEYEQFKEAFTRYLASPSEMPLQRYKSLEASNRKGSDVAVDSLHDQLQHRSDKQICGNDVTEHQLRSEYKNLDATPHPLEILNCSGVADMGMESEEIRITQLQDGQIEVEL